MKQQTCIVIAKDMYGINGDSILYLLDSPILTRTVSNNSPSGFWVNIGLQYTYMCHKRWLMYCVVSLHAISLKSDLRNGMSTDLCLAVARTKICF